MRVRLWHNDECGLCSEIQRSIEQGGWWVQYNYTEDEPGVLSGDGVAGVGTRGM